MFGVNDTNQVEELLGQLGIETENFKNISLQALEQGESRFLKDLKVNLKNVLASDHLSEKETALLALAVAVNDKNEALKKAFTKLAQKHEASNEVIAETVACAALLASNNITYRFRHFINKDKYGELPMRIKMNIMAKPISGKEFFELMSLAVSAVNGCEMCVGAHETSLLKLGANEERIWDAVRLAGVITSLGKVVY